MVTKYPGEPGKKLFYSHHWIRIVFSGLILGIYQVLLSVSLVNLIFSGPLADGLPFGIGLALISAGVISISLAIFSSFPGVLGNIQESPAILLALITSAVAGSMVSTGGNRGGASSSSAVLVPDGGNIGPLLATILVTLALSTILTGVAFFLLGRLKLGGLSRYIPYPVVGGFLAGTGWLLFLGTISLMVGETVNIQNILELFGAGKLILWLPSFLLGVVLMILMRWNSHPLLVPGVLAGSIALFYLVLSLSGLSIEQAAEMGLLLGEKMQIKWQPITLNLLQQINWSAIFPQTGSFIILAAITLVGFLLRISAIEISTKNEFEINRELNITGVTMMITGMLGGLITHHGLGITRLGYNLGVEATPGISGQKFWQRFTGIAIGAVCFGVLILGGSWIGYFPLPVVGGLLFMLAFDFLYQWIFTGWRKFSLTEFIVILIILLTIALTGFLTGVAVGLIAMLVMFVFSYSRIKVVHHEFSGLDIRSNVERSADERHLLAENGQQIYVLELQGFLFFGTANTLYEHIRQKLNLSDPVGILFIILDFRLVSGLDSSVVLSFMKLEQLVNTRGVTLVFTHPNEEILARLSKGGISLEDSSIQLFPDVDHGLEWCENQILVRAGLSPGRPMQVIFDGFLRVGAEKQIADQLINFFKQVTIQPGEMLIRQGDKADVLFFIVEGQVSIYLEVGNQNRLRLSTLSCGTIVGEMGFYLDIPRSASVIADVNTTALYLDKAGLEIMEQTEPQLASAFHALISRQLSERLLQANRGLQALRASSY